MIGESFPRPRPYRLSITGICSGYSVENGKVHPTEVIEGSVVNVICDLGFKISGSATITCFNGTLGELPRCIPIKKGRS